MDKREEGEGEMGILNENAGEMTYEKDRVEPMALIERTKHKIQDTKGNEPIGKRRE